MSCRTYKKEKNKIAKLFVTLSTNNGQNKKMSQVHTHVMSLAKFLTKHEAQVTVTDHKSKPELSSQLDQLEGYNNIKFEFVSAPMACKVS